MLSNDKLSGQILVIEVAGEGGDLRPEHTQ
jgi:hypothetical protein